MVKWQGDSLTFGGVSHRVSQIQYDPVVNPFPGCSVFDQRFMKRLLAASHCGFSSLLKYEYSILEWAHLESNQGPTGYEPVALPAELWAPTAPI